MKVELQAWKIEGRVKVNTMGHGIKVYREAIDAYYREGTNYKFRQEWLDELKSATESIPQVFTWERLSKFTHTALM